MLYGVDKIREIYLKAINMDDLDVEGKRELCLKFAELESTLGDIDRARAIYAHCSQMCDPRVRGVALLDTTNPSEQGDEDFIEISQVQIKFWDQWTNFEVAHGNENTLKELLRIKRTVQALYNTQVSDSLM